MRPSAPGPAAGRGAFQLTTQLVLDGEFLAIAIDLVHAARAWRLVQYIDCRWRPRVLVVLFEWVAHDGRRQAGGAMWWEDGLLSLLEKTAIVDAGATYNTLVDDA